MRSPRCSAGYAAALIGAAIVIASFSLHSARAAEPDPALIVGVERNGNVYVVVATLIAPVLPVAAWAVLTDFDHMADFMPTLTTSRVLHRAENRVLVEQRGRMELGSFRLPFESDRVIELSPPGAIHSHQVRGNMQRVDSTTTFAEVEGGTRIDYRVEIVPRLWLPEALGAQLMRTEIERQFSAILREIVRRKNG